MFQFLSPSIVIADGIEETMFGNNWNQLFNEQQQQNSRNGGEKQIMENEKTFQAESRNIQALEDELGGKNEEIVTDTGPKHWPKKSTPKQK